MMKNSAPKDSLLEQFREWELKEPQLDALKGGVDEFQIFIPIFNVTLNVVRDCFDGTNCSYLTYSDNGQGGIYESFTWDEE